MSFGDDLRADDNIDFVIFDIVQHRAQLIAGLGRVARQDHRPRLRERGFRFFKNAFDAWATYHE